MNAIPPTHHDSCVYIKKTCRKNNNWQIILLKYFLISLFHLFDFRGKVHFSKKGSIVCNNWEKKQVLLNNNNDKSFTLIHVCCGINEYGMSEFYKKINCNLLIHSLICYFLLCAYAKEQKHLNYYINVCLSIYFLCEMSRHSIFDTHFTRCRYNEVLTYQSLVK